MNKHSKTALHYWEQLYHRPPPIHLPRGWGAGARNLQRLLRRYINPGDKVLEIGAAPGIWLAWVAKTFGASVAGLDFSPTGVALGQQFFRDLGLVGDWRCEDVFQCSFPRGAFDVVYSNGFIEHFADPAALVGLHLELVKPGGLALITVPNYRRLYGLLQRYFDPQNFETFFLDTMSIKALRDLAPSLLAGKVEAYPFGRFDIGLLHLHRRWPGPIAMLLTHLFNLFSFLQPVDISVLCPLLVLAIRRKLDH